TPGTPVEPWWITAVDLNGDGKLDLVTSNQIGTVSVFLGNGDGSFQTERDYVLGSDHDDAVTVAAVDLNGDRKLDLVVFIVETAQVAVLMGNGDGTFGAATFYSTIVANPIGLVVGDFN